MEVFVLKERKDIDVINKSLEKLISSGYITNSDAEMLKLFYYEDEMLCMGCIEKRLHPVDIREVEDYEYY